MEIEEKPLILVGENFKRQITHENVIGFNDFVSKLSNNELSHNVQFKTGQGLSSGQLAALALLKRDSSAMRFFKKADKNTTHKLSDENIMISEPTWVAKHHYMCQLLIDENCSEMKDHLTGQHIQAMVLIEAARQMNTAVCEKYIIDNKHQESIGLVLDKLETNFIHYVYPFSAYLYYSLDKIRKTPTGYFKGNAKIEFIQNEIVCAEMNLQFSGMGKNFLEERENDGIEALLQDLAEVESHSGI